MLDRYDQDLLLDYLEDELDADRRAELDALLAEDPQLAALLHEMAVDRAALRSLPQAQAPADLVHDVTQTLERRMLLDGPVDETGPIPLARGRSLTNEPPRSISWGRVVGLTGLAASVALAAAIVVITQDNLLKRTADEFATSPGDDKAKALADADLGEGATVDAGGVPARVADNAGDGLETAKPATRSDALADVPLAERINAEGRNNTEGRTHTEGRANAEGHASEALALGQPDSHAFEGDLSADPTPPASDPSRNRDVPTAPAPAAATTPPLIGSTAAISAIQPRQQLVLLTESPDLSRDQLFAFCVDNGITILQAEPPRQQQAAREQAAAQLTEEPNTQSVADNYTLLINDSQLDTLMFRLNNKAAIEPGRAGKASVLSNQAALLTDLTDEPVNDPSAGDPSELADDQVERAIGARESIPGRANQADRQAVELRLPPDLGSPYANSRNAYNLIRQNQQANYTQPYPTKTLVQNPNRLNSGDHKSKDHADLDHAKHDKLEQGTLKANPTKRAQPVTPAPTRDRDHEAGPSPEHEAKPGTTPRAKHDKPNDHAPDKAQQTPIDPSRGNWLAVHLPVADTTPLLLHWRNEQSRNPNKLVPVMIKRAQLKDVNTRRIEQQIEWADRNAKPADDADADAAAEQAADPSKTDPAQADAANAPAKAEPAKPDEPDEPDE